MSFINESGITFKTGTDTGEKQIKYFGHLTQRLVQSGNRTWDFMHSSRVYYHSTKRGSPKKITNQFPTLDVLVCISDTYKFEH